MVLVSVPPVKEKHGIRGVQASRSRFLASHRGFPPSPPSLESMRHRIPRRTGVRLPRGRAHAAVWTLALAAIGIGRPAPAQAPTTVPITEEPSHHLVLTNDYVRVFDVTAAPHATTLIHRHDHDYLFVALGNSDITSTRTDAAPARLVLEDGAVEYAPGGFAHSVTDNSDRPFHNITIELLQPSTHVATCSQDCAQSSPCAAGPCVTVTRAVTADQWVANSLTLPPGATWTADRQWTPRLVVVVSEADVELRGEYESTMARRRAPGNLIWMPIRKGRRALVGGAVMEAATPAITNTGSNPARFVVLEWKRAG
jgi:beta-alanine degradation protein BauB